jgi:EAL domain-containing protein (putative c-di-GMP-specific phosphodiesterase class I)
MRQFRDPNFIDTVKNMITRFEVEPDRIELENIESVVMDESQIVI